MTVKVLVSREALAAKKSADYQKKTKEANPPIRVTNALIELLKIVKKS